MAKGNSKKPAAKASKSKARRPSASTAAAIKAGHVDTGLVPNARYDAGGQGRRMRGWNPPAHGPRKAVQALPLIRSRNNDAIRNEWAGAASIRSWTTGLIGVGIGPRPRTKERALKRFLNDAWREWVPYADADGVLDFYGMETLMVRCWLSSGEVFYRFRYRRLDDGFKIPLQIQLIEPDFVPMLDADSWPGLPAGHKIRQGIELDRIGRRVAYWMYREHPGDGANGINAQDLIRVPADQVRHVFEPTRPGQLRGVPALTTVLTRLKNTGDLDDAVLERQRLANLFTMFLTRQPVPDVDDTDPLTGTARKFDDSGPIAPMEPGTSQELLPGEDVKFSTPPGAGIEYQDFMRGQNLGVAAGSGLPYELMTGDIKDISDRTLRVIINEFRRFAEQRQWQIIIPMFCEPIRKAWADTAFLAGVFNAKQQRAAQDTLWSPHAWAYIHPVQDVQAKRAEVDAGFKSRDSQIMANGDDPDDIDEQRAEGLQREIDLGLKFAPIDPSKPVEPTAQEKAATARLHGETNLLNAQAESERARGRAAETTANAEADANRAIAERNRAEARCAEARADVAAAEARLAEARIAYEDAQVEALRAESELNASIVRQESEVRIAGMRDAATLAEQESNARLEALAKAEEHAEAMRAVALEAETARAETARIDLHGARLSLAELEAG